MIIASISVTTWIVWAVIGIAAGYMSGRLLNSGRLTALNVIIGACGSLLGGWGFTAACGDNETQQILSLLTALVVAGVLLWISTAIAGRFIKRDDNDE